MGTDEAEGPGEGIEAEVAAPAGAIGEEAYPGVGKGGKVSADDEAGKSAFRADARARGEPLGASGSRSVEAEPEPTNLPPLAELVERIPPPVRETLDELFRARFRRVKRIPAKLLKPAAGLTGRDRDS